MLVNTIHLMHVMDGLKAMPDKSVHCVVTSPPYYALRDYGIKGQIGLEDTPEEFIRVMVDIFNEVRMVLVDGGTLWINMGDSYWGGKGKSGQSYSSEYQNERYSAGRSYNGAQHQIAGAKQTRPTDKKHPVYKPKDLCGMPWKLAFALQEAGWYLRQDIIWSKPNPMPESVADRCTKSHEYIFLLSKSPKYYFDAFSIATPYADKTLTIHGKDYKMGKMDGTELGDGLIASDGWARRTTTRKPKEWKTPDGWDTSSGDGGHGSFHKDGREKGAVNSRNPRPGVDTRAGNQGSVNGIPATSERLLKYQNDEIGGRGFIGHSGYHDSNGDLIGNGKANKRSVWTVSTIPFKEAHFATFPEALIVDCIKAGCPPDGIVLDPFMGAGTTAIVASKLGRNFIGFEINPKYLKMAINRLKKVLGMFMPKPFELKSVA